MLCLLFHLGAERYALETGQVLEVIPIVRIKSIPQARAGIAGLINYRGRSVPVLDLSALATGKEASRKLSTRILMVEYERPDCGKQLLGLLAERATETIRIKESDFHASGLHLPDASYLGPVAQNSRGMIQKVEISKLIPVEVQSLLFSPVAHD